MLYEPHLALILPLFCSTSRSLLISSHFGCAALEHTRECTINQKWCNTIRFFLLPLSKDFRYSFLHIMPHNFPPFFTLIPHRQTWLLCFSQKHTSFQVMCNVKSVNDVKCVVPEDSQDCNCIRICATRL